MTINNISRTIVVVCEHPCESLQIALDQFFLRLRVSGLDAKFLLHRIVRMLGRLMVVVLRGVGDEGV